MKGKARNVWTLNTTTWNSVSITFLLFSVFSLCVTPNYNPGQKSLGQYCNIHIFLSFLGSLLKQCIIFEIFLQFSLPPPYTKLNLWKNSGYTRPTLFVGWGEGLDLCELENAPETQKCPKTFVHDCRSKSSGYKIPDDRLVHCTSV